MRPEAHIETERTQPDAAAEPELHLLALVAGHAAAQGQKAEPLLAADVNHGAAARVHDVAADGRARPHAQGRVGDVIDRELGRRLHMVSDDGRNDRIADVVEVGAVDTRVLPGQLGADVVHTYADLHRTGDEHDPHVAPDAAPERRADAVIPVDQPLELRRHGVGAGEQRVAGREAARTDGAVVRDAEVIADRGAEVHAVVVIAASAGDSAGEAQCRREPRLHEPVAEQVVRRIGARRVRILEKRAEGVAQEELDVVVLEPLDAEPEALDAEPHVEQTARTAESELILGDQHLRGTEVESERVPPDGERDVVGRRRRLSHLEEDREVEHQVHELDGVERRGVGIEHRVVAQLVDRVIVEELDQPERHRDGQLGVPAAGAVLQGPVRRIIASQVAVPRQRNAPQPSTSRRAMASPRPEPLDVVEKVGSNTRGSTSGAMPRPSSTTLSVVPPSRTLTVTRLASALRAFSRRLTSTSFTSSLRASAVAPSWSARTSYCVPLFLLADPRPYSCTTSRAAAARSTASSGSCSAAGAPNRENARAIPSRRSISTRMRPAVSSSVDSKAAPRFTRCRCWIPSRIGVSGFLISCATWRAISPHAMTRAARVSAVASSSAMTQPSGAGPSAASWTRIWRPPISNSFSAIASPFAATNAVTACHTGAHAGGAARGSSSPGASDSPSNSSARAFAIVTRSASSTAITPVAMLASTRAVRCRASSIAAWLRRTSVTMRPNADSTGSNSRGAPGGNAAGSVPRPTASAAARSAATGFASPPAARPAR